jgi:hypothetical protein
VYHCHESSTVSLIIAFPVSGWLEVYEQTSEISTLSSPFEYLLSRPVHNLGSAHLSTAVFLARRVRRFGIMLQLISSCFKNRKAKLPHYLYQNRLEKLSILPTPGSEPYFPSSRYNHDHTPFLSPSHSPRPNSSPQLTNQPRHRTHHPPIPIPVPPPPTPLTLHTSKYSPLHTPFLSSPNNPHLTNRFRYPSRAWRPFSQAYSCEIAGADDRPECFDWIRIRWTRVPWIGGQNAKETGAGQDAGEMWFCVWVTERAWEGDGERDLPERWWWGCCVGEDGDDGACCCVIADVGVDVLD